LKGHGPAPREDSEDALLLQKQGNNHEIEPPRDCRRPFGLSYAAMAGSSSMA
jgi:hypothetical protein